MSNRTFACVIMTTLLGTAAVPACAQDAAAASTPAASGGGIEEIVVTAQKRAESLQGTPISIAAFSGKELEAKGINGLTDLRANVPALQLTPFPNNAATTQIFMRGVGLSDDQITQDGGVAVYMDGVYVARSQGMAVEVADLERIEVLRGPQGTLYGRNATGGAINFITRKPDLGEFGFKAQATLGNFDNRHPMPDWRRKFPGPHKLTPLARNKKFPRRTVWQTIRDGMAFRPPSRGTECHSVKTHAPGPVARRRDPAKKSSLPPSAVSR